MESMPQISSIYIYDEFGHRYGVDQSLLKRDQFSDIKQVPWFGDLAAQSGAYLLKLDSGGLFQMTVEESYISHVRIINDLDSLEPIGVLVINITSEAIARSIGQGLDPSNSDVAVFDDNGQIVNAFSNQALAEQSPAEIIGSTQPQIVEGDEHRYLLASQILPNDWTVANAIRYDRISDDARSFSLVTLSVLALAVAVLFIGAIAISRMITVPVIRLQKTMSQVEKGNFPLMPATRRQDEICKLVAEIQELLRKTIQDQSSIRQAELQALQAQIKPHFLYNTFDAISSLAMDGDNKKIYTLVKALGSYYRLSISKGSEVISLRDELDIVRNYLAIQKIRYSELFESHISLDETVANAKVLKLILQPLVENALYHGLKPLGSGGLIEINAQADGDNILLTVRDNGVGMDEATLAEIQAGSAGNAGFGLRTTLERLSIFYGIQDFYKISSQPGKGTVIEIRIPRSEG
jgi:two-component system sensor histidine kinase YesM